MQASGTYGVKSAIESVNPLQDRLILVLAIGACGKRIGY